MKNKLLFIMLICCIQVSMADEIILHKGDTIKGKLTEISEDFIKYIPDGEDLIRTIGTFPVEKINFDNGKVETITPLIVIGDPKKEWDNVVISYDKNAVKGMFYIGKSTKKANSAWSTNTKKEGLERKVFEKLKKECAKQGGKVILVTRKDSQSQGGFGSYGFAEISVEFYCY